MECCRDYFLFFKANLEFSSTLVQSVVLSETMASLLSESTDWLLAILALRENDSFTELRSLKVR